MTLSDVRTPVDARLSEGEVDPPKPPRRRAGRAPWLRGALVAALVVGLGVGLGVGILMGRGDRPASSATDAEAMAGMDMGSAAPASNPALPAGAHNQDETAEAVPDVPLDAATRAKLAAQLVAARAAALRFPTVADAVRAGYVPAGTFAPETGAHYQKLRVPSDLLPDGSVNPGDPASIIYDGNSPSSRVVGLMYESFGTGAAPQGFAGPNDHWHRHSNVCVRFGSGGIQVPFAADSDVTAQECATVHGLFMQKTIWMVHAWVVPSWESPLGVFSHDNPNLKCADGTVNANSRGFCQGT